MASYNINLRMEVVSGTGPNATVIRDLGDRTLQIPIVNKTIAEINQLWSSVQSEVLFWNMQSDFINKWLIPMNYAESKALMPNIAIRRTQSGVDYYTDYYTPDFYLRLTFSQYFARWTGFPNFTANRDELGGYISPQYVRYMDYDTGSCISISYRNGIPALSIYVNGQLVFSDDHLGLGAYYTSSGTTYNPNTDIWIIVGSFGMFFEVQDGFYFMTLGDKKSQCHKGALAAGANATALHNWLVSLNGGGDYSVTYHLVHATGDANNPSTISASSTFTSLRFYPADNYELKYGSAFYTADPEGERPTVVWNANTGMMQIGQITNDITVEVISVIKAYPVDPSEPTDPGTIDPDSPNYDFSSTIIPIPPKPAWDYSKAGFCNVYVPSAQQLNFLAQYLWSSSFDADNFKKMFNNPMEAIIGCHLVPLANTDMVLDEGYLAYGNNATNIRMPTARETWIDVDCGYVKLPVYYSAYMSYNPYTKVYIFLPFIGVQALDSDAVIGKYVELLYRFDIVSGSCVALISVSSEPYADSTLMYQFAGMCASEIPVTQGDYKNIIQTIQSVVSSSVGIGMGAKFGRGQKNEATGNRSWTKGGLMQAAGGAISGLGALGSSIEDMIKPDISITGNISSTAGFLGGKTPYLLISTPRVCLPDEQANFIGFPIYATSRLQQLTGFTQIDSIHLEGFYYTEDELSELEELLKNGVIL